MRPMLLSVAVLALLAACASAAGIVLADAIRQQPEMAVRHALGATRRRLVWLAIGRTLCWTVPGGLSGVILAWTVLEWIGASGAGHGSNPLSELDWLFIAASAIALTGAAGLLLGGLAALLVGDRTLALGLKEAEQAHSPSRRRRLALAAIVSVQIAAATSLGVVSGMLIRSMVNLVNVDLGFEPAQAFLVRVFLPDDQYGTREEQSVFFENALARVRAVRGVASAGISNTPPLSRVVVTSGWNYLLETPGRTPEALGPLVTQYVSPGYFESIGMRVNRGRGFTDEDYRAAASVIIVDEAFYRVHVRGGDALEVSIRMGGTPFHIIGVMHDVRQDGPIENARPTLYVLRDKRHTPAAFGHFVVRPSAATTAVMQRVVSEVVALDRRVVVDDPQTLRGLLAAGLAQRQRTLRLLALAAAVVFMLTWFSVTGALGDFVENKRREMALRKALGASQRDTILLLANYLAVPSLIGLLLGCVAGLLLARTLATELFGVAPTDPATVAAAVAALLMVGVVAAAGPISRAIAVDPSRALRAL